MISNHPSLTAPVNYWLFAGPFVILIVMFLITRRRSLALALLASAVAHGAFAGYFVLSSKTASDDPPLAELAPPLPIPFPMPPETPPVEGPPEPPPAAPAWTDQLAAPKTPVLSDNILPMRPSHHAPDLGTVPKLDHRLFETVLPTFQESPAKRLNAKPIDLEDLIAKRLKDALGEEGKLTVTLIWFNKNDLDIHVKDPLGNWIHWNAKDPEVRSKLDVDRNAGTPSLLTNQPIENIRWPKDGPEPPHGKYTVFVDHFAKRDVDPSVFFVRIKFGDKVVHLLHGQVSYDPVRRYPNPQIKLIEFYYP
jgi:hypothetical protein